MREGVFTPEQPKIEVAPGSTSKPTVKEYFESIFLPNYVKTELSPGSIRNYKEAFNKRLIPQFGTIPMDKVSSAMVDDFLSALGREGLSRNTVRLHVAAARKMFNHAIKRELISKNPFANVGKSYTSARAKKKPDYLKFNEVPVFMKAVCENFPEFHDFFAVAILAGLREGELKALRYGDLQLGDENTIMMEPYIRVGRSASQAGVMVRQKPKTNGT